MRKLGFWALCLGCLLTGCGKQETAKGVSEDLNNEEYHEQSKLRLSDEWEATLDQLPKDYEDRKEILRKAIHELSLPAQEGLRELVEAVPLHRQKEVLYDLSSPFFEFEEVRRLINIILRLKSKNPKLILRICKESNRVSLWDQIKVYALKRRLGKSDQELLNKLIENLAIDELI